MVRGHRSLGAWGCVGVRLEVLTLTTLEAKIWYVHLGQDEQQAIHRGSEARPS